MSEGEPFDTLQAAVIDSTTLRTLERVEIPVRDAGFSFTRRAPGVPDAEVVAIVAEE
jgi:hypothetical protein